MAVGSLPLDGLGAGEGARAGESSGGMVNHFEYLVLCNFCTQEQRIEIQILKSAKNQPKADKKRKEINENDTN